MDTVAPPVEGAVKLVELASIDSNSVVIFATSDITRYLNRKQGFSSQLYFRFLCYTVIYPLKLLTAIFPVFKHAERSSSQIITDCSVNVR